MCRYHRMWGGPPPTFFKISKIQFWTPPNGPLQILDPYFWTPKPDLDPYFWTPSRSKSDLDPYFWTPSRSQNQIWTPIFGPLDLQKSDLDPYFWTPKSQKFPRAFGAFPPLNLRFYLKSAQNFRAPSARDFLRTPIFGPLFVPLFRTPSPISKSDSDPYFRTPPNAFGRSQKSTSGPPPTDP